jgi:hypothetical protein
MQWPEFCWQRLIDNIIPYSCTFHTPRHLTRNLTMPSKDCVVLPCYLSSPRLQHLVRQGLGRDIADCLHCEKQHAGSLTFLHRRTSRMRAIQKPLRHATE